MNAPLTKFVPVTVNVNPAEPAATLVGESAVTVGTGFDGAVIVNVTEFDGPPPGVGFETTTKGVPVLATSAARIAAVSCVALTNVVVLAVPLNKTDELEIKFVPVTVNVNAPDPAAAFAGEILLMVGTGLLPATTLKFTRFDWPPPGAGFETATVGIPTLAISLAKIAAVSCVALTNVVTLAVPLNNTDELEIKFVPFTVNVNAGDPAVAPAGDKPDIVGMGLLAPLTT